MNGYLGAFELLNFLLLFICAHDAWRVGGLRRLAELAAGVFFGLALELATIAQLEAYEYGRFPLMVLQVPLAIGIGWGVILHSVRRFSDAVDMPAWARPLLDGLVALTIDLAMDAIAIRLGMWDWGAGLEYQYFGVPFGNFWAWFFVVAGFSAGVRAASRLPGAAGRWLTAPAGLIVGLVAVLCTNALYVFVIPSSLGPLAVALVLVGALAAVARTRPVFHVRPAGSASWLVATGYHGYFLVVGLHSGTIMESPILLAAALAMIGINIALHWRRRASVGV
jgi:hypothetical protein